MLEGAQILAAMSVMLLIGTLIAWMNLLGRPRLRLPRGSAAANPGNRQLAAFLLLAAVGLSAVAAMLTIAGWFSV